MGLDLYREVSTGTYAKYYEYGSSTTLLPIVTTHDGVLGETVEIRIFVRNDDPDEYYTNISVQPVSISDPDDVSGTTTGHGVKICAGSTQPTEAEWTAIDYASSISLSSLGSAGNGDINTYLPFWARFEVSAGSPADNRENIVLRVSYLANSV